MLYLNFCASIHSFYVRKKDRMPDAMTFWLSSTILTANFFTIYNLLNYYYLPKLPFSVGIVFVFFGVIASINYFIIFYSGSFKEKTPSSSFGFGVILYMIISVAAVIYTGSQQREKNLKDNQRQQIEQRQRTEKRPIRRL
jgi:hypothetical protein